MRILALDLGNATTKTYASFLDTNSGEIVRTSFPTSPKEITAQCDRLRPERLVVEATLNTGWVADLIRARGGIELQVAKPTDPVMQARRTAKTDRHDADLLLKLSVTEQLTTVIIPDASTRGWRALIAYRQRLVQDRTKIKNRIKALLRQQGIPTSHLWTEIGHGRLIELARPLADCLPADAWRGILHLDLRRLTECNEHLHEVTNMLDAIGKPDTRVQKLMELEGVGPRSAEALALPSTTRCDSRPGRKSAPISAWRPGHVSRELNPLRAASHVLGIHLFDPCSSRSLGLAVVDLDGCKTSLFAFVEMIPSGLTALSLL